MPSRAGAFAVSAVLLSLVAGVAQACDCTRFRSPTEQMTRSDAVFRGRVLKVRRLADGRVVSTIAVAEILKGKLPRLVDVANGPSADGACGLSLRQGDVVSLAARRDADGGWSTGACTRLQFPWEAFRQAARADRAASW
ncbi:MAG TPA: hypothetical protein VEA15_00090 [Caulobacteraceae bacterium]|nr:hypothetical protein [Caulobacteraceae bacterium]